MTAGVGLGDMVVWWLGERAIGWGGELALGEPDWVLLYAGGWGKTEGLWSVIGPRLVFFSHKVQLVRCPQKYFGRKKVRVSGGEDV